MGQDQPIDAMCSLWTQSAHHCQKILIVMFSRITGAKGSDWGLVVMGNAEGGKSSMVTGDLS
ncbi:hypothetical protein [Neptunomonas antarctica]|uniref:hypothetical protein n=1 Tax=Neptunomonas antarctica TaxID=619304 RepID=UPI0006C7D931|nr:hypothetical protein [Neptunomonas antarctica]